MREIKFRAWNKEEELMVDLQKITPLALDDMMNTQLALQGRTGLFIPFFEELELMQYTGLEDKNGVEIYEGDIINDSPNKKSNNNRQVVYELCSFYTPLIKADNHIGVNNIELSHFYMPNGQLYEHYKLEVIGNIYENPELLK